MSKSVMAGGIRLTVCSLAAALSLALAGCTGSQQPEPRQLVGTSIPAATGDYCTAAAAQLDSINMLEKASKQKSSPQTLDELLKFSGQLAGTLTLQKDIGAAAASGGPLSAMPGQGFYLGGSYFVSAAYPFVVQKGSSYVIAPFNNVLVIPNSPKNPNAMAVQNITALLDRDMVLIYSPSGTPENQHPLISLRPMSTLTRGEPVYNITLRSGVPVVQSGEVINFPVTGRDSGSSLTYYGQIVTSIIAGKGDSGSPVFDGYGNLVGVVSVGVLWNGEPATNVASTDALWPLLESQKGRLADCLAGK